MKITRRQVEILELAASGLTDKEIAQKLCISYRTVRTHLERLTTNNEVRGRTAIVAHWLARGRAASSSVVNA
jgi:DNA-binding CsgD family transcriptional regulator